MVKPFYFTKKKYSQYTLYIIYRKDSILQAIGKMVIPALLPTHFVQFFKYGKKYFLKNFLINFILKQILNIYSEKFLFYKIITNKLVKEYINN